MKKALAIMIALISAWVLFLPFDMPLFFDEAIALVLLTKSLRYLGFDISQFIPFINSHKRSASAPGPKPKHPDPVRSGPTIDV